MDALILDLVIKYPVIAKVLIFVGVARFIFKPLMSAVQNHVNLSPSKEDDAKLRRIMTSTPYFIFSFLLDLTASIKLPKK